MQPFTIVAYTYNADTYCGECVTEQVLARSAVHSTVLDYLDTEGDLNRIASYLGIDRQDESSFDSGDFPKVVFADMVEDDCCGNCGSALID